MSSNTPDNSSLVGETGKARRLAPQPDRTYELPGGPYAASLGTIDLAILSEIERGGMGDGNRS